MPTLANDELHESPTQRSQYQYLFTKKHHGADPNAGQWSPSLSLEEEFVVFDKADWHELSDAEGNLYGVQPHDEDGLRYLGTETQQVARFPLVGQGGTWHGYPLYPLPGVGEKCRPAKEVFGKMRQAGLISERQRRRLMKGDHA